MVLVKRAPAVAALAISLLALGAGGCKTSGMALTGKGELMKINITAPTDMTEGSTEEVKVDVSNRGVGNLKNVAFDVELPSQLLVLSQVPEKGMNESESVGSSGRTVYHYMLGNLQVGETATVSFHVRSAFGTYKQSDNIVVNAWSDDLPNGKLMETKFVKLRS